MKAFLCIDVTKNKKNDVIDGEELICQRNSLEQTDAIEKSIDETDTIVKKHEIPFIIQLIGKLSLLGALIIVASILKADVSISQAYQNAPWAFYLVPVLLFIGIAIILLERSKNKKLVQDDEYQTVISRSDSIINNAYATLGVPSDAKSIDVLTSLYKIKNGELKLKSLGISDFLNAELKIFADDDFIYLADAENKWQIAKSEITGIKKINKRVSIPTWNKEVPYNKGEFKQYKITVNNLDLLFFKPYYALCFNHNGEDYEMYFPPYELDVIKERACVNEIE